MRIPSCSPVVARVGLAAAFCVGSSPAEAQATLEAQPSTIAVSPWYQDVAARVVLRNTGAKPLLKAAISYFTNDGFRVELSHAGAARVEPSGILSVPVRIAELAHARIPGAIQFEARYTAEDGAPQSVFASLNVTAQSDAEKPVEVSVYGSFDAIAANQPGEGYILVSNSLDVPVTVAGVEILRPRSIRPPAAIGVFEVPAHSSASREFRLEAGDRVRPGKYAVAIAVNAEWDSGGHRVRRNFVVSRDINVGVFFESDLLKALGVPSFLLLPGCLFLFTMQLLLALGLFGLKNDSSVPQLSVTSPGFWVLSVTISGLFAAVYRLATGTDYLSYYGVRDLMNVWIWSIIAGAATYVAAAGIWAARRRKRTPTAQDDPITALRRMQSNGVPVVTGAVTYKLNGLDLRSFLIEPIQDGQTVVWVAPRIVTQWSGDPAAQNTFEEAINQRRSPGELAGILAHAVQKNIVSIRWASAGTVPNPYHLKVDAITAYQPPDVIVEVT